MIFFLETKTTKRIHNTNDTPKIRSYLVRESGKKKCGIHLKNICMYVYVRYECIYERKERALAH